MVSSPTSELRFLSVAGEPLEGPSEWSRCLVWIERDPSEWERLRLRRNGEELPLYLKHIGSTARILADWPLSGAGAYRLELCDVLGSPLARRTCRVAPRKLSEEGFHTLVDDLHRRLPATVAIALQRVGALAGVELVPPQETTLAEEWNRLERACRGTSARRGLVEVLVSLARQAHEVLKTLETWSPRERARRVSPSRLVHAFIRPANLDAQHMPLTVPEQRVEHSVDTYENRLVKAFYQQVDQRLRAVITATITAPESDVHRGACALLRDLKRARHAAAFLDDVGPLIEPPARLTMVLLKRSDYRAALEGLLEFRRSALVRVDEPALDAPLTNLPRLYETWCLLEVIAQALELAAEFNFRVGHEALVVRSPNQMWVRVLRDGRPAVVLNHRATRAEVRLIPQRTYASRDNQLHSMSFQQRPDLAVEVSTASRTQCWIFDPKYKLDSEEIEGEQLDARPKKVDIDAMHSYRDAIRDGEGRHAVAYAAILYPGRTRDYGPGLQAIGAAPDRAGPMREVVGAVLRDALQHASATPVVAA